MENVVDKELTVQFELMEEVIAPGTTADFLSGVSAGAGTAGVVVGVIWGGLALT
ncbi:MULTISPECIES: hypothetical protein [Bacillus cereus group]|uniref:hypothetical protein n=1 Tax=Bacillus cereus group TaxID=86661 RepID=UPI00032D9261|nr:MULTISPECIES: hypothetical protein [Bacillus cereus group]EOO13483.1 hypothetical protein IG9_04896 [Bacillus cereus HuA2-9]